MREYLKNADLVFWSQDLENRDDELVVSWKGLRGEPDSDPEAWSIVREYSDQVDLIDRVSRVREDGRKVYQENAVRADIRGLFPKSYEFIVEVPSSKRDVGGRQTRFICYGKMVSSSEGWGERICGNIQYFADNYDRPLRVSPRWVAEALEAVSKKKRSAVRKVIATLVLAGILIAVVAGFLVDCSQGDRALRKSEGSRNIQGMRTLPTQEAVRRGSSGP